MELPVMPPPIMSTSTVFSINIQLSSFADSSLPVAVRECFLLSADLAAGGGQVRTQLDRRGASRSFAALRMTSCKARYLLFHRLDHQFAVGCIDLDCISVANGTVEDASG